MISVRATEKFSVYFNYQVWNLAAGEQVDGELAEYLLATSSPVEEISAGPAVDTESDGVPAGTATQVTAWVDSDPVKAALALAAEQRREPPRSTLVAALQKLIPVEPVSPPESSDTGQSTTPAPPAEPES